MADRLKRSKKPDCDQIALKTSRSTSIDDLGQAASVLLDRVLADDMSGYYEVEAPLTENVGKPKKRGGKLVQQVLTRAEPKKRIYISNEIDRLVETAVQLHRTMWPGTVKRYARLTWWLKRGVAVSSERVQSTSLKVHGENDFSCLFCRLSLATYGWDDGVRQLVKEAVEKHLRHTRECALRMLVMYATDPDSFPSTARHLEVALYKIHSKHAQLVELTNEEASQ